MRLGLAYFATEFDSLNLWKNPVQQCQFWRIRRLQQFPCGCSIVGDLNIEAPFLEMPTDKVPIYRGIFRQKDLHGRFLLARFSPNVGNRMVRSRARRSNPVGACIRNRESFTTIFQCHFHVSVNGFFTCSFCLSQSCKKFRSTGGTRRNSQPTLPNSRVQRTRAWM